MSKPVLGRGLGALLNGRATDASPEKSPLSSRNASNPAIGRGLGTLIKGGKASSVLENLESSTGDSNQLSEPTIPAWYFFGLDLLLLAFVGLTVVTSSPLDWLGLLVCSIAIGLGAVIFTIPIWNHYRALKKCPVRSQVPEWVVTEKNAGDGHSRRFVIHLHQPVFIGEIIESPERKTIVMPLWIEGDIELSDASVERLKRKAELMLSV